MARSAVTTVTLAGLKAHAARLVASTLAIVISAGFVVATLTLGETSRTTLLDAVGARYVGADVVVSAGGTLLDDDVRDRVADVAGVRAVDPAYSTSVQAVAPGRTGEQYLQVDSIAADRGLRWQHLADGAFPDALGEVAVSERVGADVGDELPVTTFDADGDESSGTVRVVGIVDLGGDPTAGNVGRAFVTTAQAEAWGAGDPTELRIAAGDGTDAEQLADRVDSALAEEDLTVRTGEQEAENQVALLARDTRVLTVILLVFGTVAVVVAALVVANTFAVLLAQRTRELALLRCVGATGRQVRRGVLAEAAITGFLASVLGVGAGIGLATAVSAVVGTDSPFPLSGVSVPASAVVAGVAVGTLTTLVAALVPARAATKVPPLAALRPLDPVPVRSRGGLVRLGLGLVGFVVGLAVMAYGAATGEIMVAVPGGALSFLGVVLLAQRAVPPVVAAAGRLVRAGGVTARLAGGNANRNPRRTAATATALLIGVTLTSAMVVGAASTRSSAAAGLVAQYPTDVAISGNSEDGVPSSLVDALTGIDGVAAGAGLLGGDVITPDGYETHALGVDPQRAATVLRSTGDLPLPSAGSVVLPWYTVESWSLADGDRIGLGGRTFTARFGDTDYPLFTEEDLRALDPDAVPDTVWLRLTDDAAASAVIDEVTDVTGTEVPTANVSGLASERAALDEVLDVLLLVVTGLLGVAVLIALIGVGNTLALSVVERRQENGLLRALGLTRRQLRGLLAWEAGLVAGVAAVIGTVLGAGYGLAGATTVLGHYGELQLTIPWLQIGAIVVVATVAGLLASVLPARRAARTPPVAALAV